jgi:hypothetical protein
MSTALPNPSFHLVPAGELKRYAALSGETFARQYQSVRELGN